MFILQDCESTEAESGIAQTTVGMYIFLSEGAGVGSGDQPTDVGVEVLQCHSSLGCLRLFGLIYVLNCSYAMELKCTFEENPGYNQSVTKVMTIEI